MASELTKRITFTLGALLVWRLGLFVPLPGIDSSVMAALLRPQWNGGPADIGLFAGSAIHRVSIFALGIWPYVTAGVILQLATMASRRLQALAQQGYRGRRTVVMLTRSVALVLSAAQAAGIAVGLEEIRDAVPQPGFWFVGPAVLTLVGGAMLLVWLSEQITMHGVGNGIAVLLFADVVSGLSARLAQASQLESAGMLAPGGVLSAIMTAVAVTGLVVLIELARRNLSIRFAARHAGEPSVEAPLGYLSFKLNPAGMLPALLALWLTALTVDLVNLLAPDLAQDLDRGGAAYPILYGALIVVCSLVYAAYIVAPQQTAERLQKLGGAIPMIEPGAATAADIDRIGSRHAVAGAIYLTFICLLPEILFRLRVPFWLTGTEFLVVVCAVLDFAADLRARRAHLHLRSPGRLPAADVTC
jgi:preprotein translocase subunit SecY